MVEDKPHLKGLKSSSYSPFLIQDLPQEDYSRRGHRQQETACLVCGTVRACAQGRRNDASCQDDSGL
jgi:hypothetical protein